MERAPRIVALVPACNEEDQIGQTIESLLAQTHRIDRILVIPNNCTDRTPDIALRYAADHASVRVMEIRENTGKKAGALNRAVASLDPDEWDFVLQMDADTTLDHRLVEEGLREFRRNPKLGGVSSRCALKPYEDGTSLWKRILWSLQNLEYGFGDTRDIQNSGRVNVLAGAVCMYRMDVLVNVARIWKHRDRPGMVWREDSVVEDYELTLDAQKLGYDTEAGMRMFSWTDAMFSVSDLKNQRFRWYGGMAVTLKRRRLAPEVRLEVVIQLYYLLVVISRIALLLFLALILLLVPLNQIQPHWWWLPMAGLIMGNYIRRFQYVRNRDATQWAIILTLIPLELYITWDQILTLVAYSKNLIAPSKSW